MRAPGCPGCWASCHFWSQPGLSRGLCGQRGFALVHIRQGNKSINIQPSEKGLIYWNSDCTNQGYQSLWGIAICIREWNSRMTELTWACGLNSKSRLSSQKKGSLNMYTIVSHTWWSLSFTWPLLPHPPPWYAEIYIASVRKPEGNYIL